MLKVYEISYAPRGSDDRVAFVAAINPSQAKYLARSDDHCRFYHEDWTAMLAQLYPYEGAEEHLEGIDKPQWLFDNETNEDVLDAERRWFDGQCL